MMTARSGIQADQRTGGTHGKSGTSLCRQVSAVARIGCSKLVAARQQLGASCSASCCTSQRSSCDGVGDQIKCGYSRSDICLRD